MIPKTLLGGILGGTAASMAMTEAAGLGGLAPPQRYATQTSDPRSKDVYYPPRLNNAIGTFTIFRADNGFVAIRNDGVESSTLIATDIQDLANQVITALVNDKVGK